MQYQIPGVAAIVTVSPMRWPVCPRTSLSLHGALSMLLGVPHGKFLCRNGETASQAPNFVIQGHVATTSAWRNHHGTARQPPIRVHFIDGEATHRLDGFDGPVEVWGAVRRVQIKLVGAHAVAPLPHHCVLRSTSPLVVRGTGCAREAVAMDGELLLGAVRALRRKLGHTGAWAPRAEVRVTRQRHVAFDTGWSPRVRGGLEWEAAADLDGDAALWFAVGEYLGVGTYISRGYGRYVVEPMASDVEPMASETAQPSPTPQRRHYPVLL